MDNLKNIQTDFVQIAQLIEEARNRAFQKVNEELVLLHYRVGEIVFTRVSEGNWGDGTVDELASWIAVRYPGKKGFNRRGLYRMKQFYETWALGSPCFLLWQEHQSTKVSPAASQTSGRLHPIVSPLATQFKNIDNQHINFISKVITQLPWTHHLELFSVTKSPEQGLFYLLSAIQEKWTKLDLRRQIQSAAFERASLGGHTLATLNPSIPQNLFKDPYIFEFLELPENHSERDIEKAISQNLQKFILEIGKGFTYMGSQYRLQVGNKDYHTDLLFFHRDLRCMVLFELKMQEFEPEFLGKLNFYLEALDRDVKLRDENPSIGVLLCKGKDAEVVEYSMARSHSSAIIADYETKLIPRITLANKLNQLIQLLSGESDY